MSLTLQVQHAVRPRIDATDRTLDIASMFGLSLDGGGTHVVLPPVTLALKPGQVVFVTGVSGGGKSTLLRLIQEGVDQCPPDDGPAVIALDGLAVLRDEAIVEALARPEGDATLQPASIEKVCGWLSRAGLNDAAVMLRRPGELSEGQRHRLRLAQAVAVSERRGAVWTVLLADEFGSALDRTTAHAMARSVAKWVRRSGICLVAATAHDDLLEPLAPDLLVEVNPGRCAVYPRPD